MSSGRKDPKDDDKLLTSEDLFGDMLDAKPASAPKPPPAPAGRRSGPIKVQVSEPSTATPAPTPTPTTPAPAKTPSGRITLPKGPLPKSPLGGPPAEALPDDVAALLDAFSAPGEAAAAAPPEPEPPAAPGEGAYGPYRLLERVAVGGMAEVFKAKRSGVEGFEKVVAVKRILPHLSDNKEFVDMFVDEAKMVAGLTHPNIVQIFDLGRIERSYYIAMEYVQGRDLRSILRRARERAIRVPLDLCALIASRVCSALEYAHRNRDA